MMYNVDMTDQEQANTLQAGTGNTNRTFTWSDCRMGDVPMDLPILDRILSAVIEVRLGYQERLQCVIDRGHDVYIEDLQAYRVMVQCMRLHQR